jgi:hypothetical protein
MAIPLAPELVLAAQAADYQMIALEQPRSRRWLLTLRDRTNMTLLVVIQSCPLVSATDVQSWQISFAYADCSAASSGPTMGISAPRRAAPVWSCVRRS